MGINKAFSWMRCGGCGAAMGKWPPWDVAEAVPGVIHTKKKQHKVKTGPMPWREAPAPCCFSGARVKLVPAIHSKSHE